VKPVLVEWKDSCHHSAWRNIEDVKDLHISRCVTVGLLAKENEDEITVIQSMDTPERDQVDSCMTIPRAVITRIRDLRMHRRW
jgi:hypothetical protein